MAVLLAFLPMTVLRSGEVHYDGSNREVKLVAHIQSKKARSNLWAVMKHDKSLEDVDFEPGGKKYRGGGGGVDGVPPRRQQAGLFR